MDGERGARDATGSGTPVSVAGSGARDEPDRPELMEVVDRLLAVLARVDVPYVFIGGIASMLLGRRRWIRDVDVLVRIEDARRVLEALAADGFEIEETHPHWLYKAALARVTVDVIFRSTRDVMLDDEMLDRTVWRELDGRRIPLAPPEDVIVMKAIATDEDTARYWYDALAIIGHSELDWDYLLDRAHQHGARRVLSLLLYAQSNDLLVPNRVIEVLIRRILWGGGVRWGEG